MQYRNFITSPRESSVPEAKRYSYYKSGVKIKFPKKGPALRMQILPAFDPANPADPQGSVPCLVNGQPTAWFGMVQAAKFVGHGDWKSTLPILSLDSFDGKEPCPYQKLLRYCKENPDWKYLVSRTGRFGSVDFQDAVLKPVKSILLLNIVNVDNPGEGVQLGEFSYSVANDLLNVEDGIVFQRNLQIQNMPGADVALAQNPMLAYANGDITDPGRAPVFIVELPPVKQGQFGSGYTCRIDIQKGQLSQRACSDLELAARYHLDDPESFLNIPTGQGIVDELVMLLKGHKNAQGVDETCAIKEAVGDMYRVETVSAPGASSTIQSGFSGDFIPQVQTYAAPDVPSSGFAPNPAVNKQTAHYAPPAGQPAAPSVAPAVAAAAQAAPSVIQHAVGAIPGEQLGGADASMAASIAARMRAQMALRK